LCIKGELQTTNYSGFIRLAYDGNNPPFKLKASGTGIAGEQKLVNGSFEIDSNHDKVPDGWFKSSTWIARDGRDCAVSRSANCSVKLTGTGNIKTLAYTFNISGKAKDDYLLTLWSKASNVPVHALYRVQLIFFSGKDIVSTLTQDFATDAHDFIRQMLAFTTPGTYTRVVVRIQYKAASGSVWFDDASLKYAP
jgi:hypothetical protein